MKKKYTVTLFVTLILITSITTLTVFAKTVRNSWEERKLRMGYTEDDIERITSILFLTDENVPDLVEAKYKELRDWDKVVESYGLDPKQFNEFVETQKRIQKDLEIPDEIYVEMKNSGMTENDCKKFSIEAHNARIDLETAWKGKKSGKEIKELIKERTKIKNEKAQLATDFTFGRITKDEYVKSMKKLEPNISETEINEYAKKDREQWEKLRIKSSGIAESEIELAKSMGMTDILEMCSAKEAEKMTKITFKEIISKVKKGEAINSVIKNNISKEKIEKQKKISIEAKKIEVSNKEKAKKDMLLKNK